MGDHAFGLGEHGHYPVEIAVLLTQSAAFGAVAMKFSVRTILFFVVLATVATALISNFYGTIGVEDALAELDSVQMLIAYMEEHEGGWPADWEALRPQFESCAYRVGSGKRNPSAYSQEYGFKRWSFEKLKSRIWIEFDVESDELRQISKTTSCPSFNVISARFRGWQLEDDPNDVLWSYFRSKQVN